MIEGKQKMKQTRKKGRIVRQVLVFDVDGVLTDLVQKRNTELELFFQIIKRLDLGEPIVLNTGRTVEFLLEKIIEPLEKLVADKSILKNLFVIGEKGTIDIEYDGQGKRSKKIDPSLAIPRILQIEIKRLVAEKFSEIVFYDSTKENMVSLEMIDGLSVRQFQEREKELGDCLKRILAARGMAGKYKINFSQIAVDVEDVRAGKDLGVRKMRRWLAREGIGAEKFVVFGDSVSDLEMADELCQFKLPVEFVFVGEDAQIADKKRNFPIICTVNHGEAGTLEYLQKLS